MIPPFLMKYWTAFAGIALAVAILSLAFCQGKQSGKSGEIVKQQGREIEVQKDLGTAAGNAADIRVKDATKAVQQQKELQDALKATSDPDRQRVLRGCIVMRQQGRNTDSIPACR